MANLEPRPPRSSKNDWSMLLLHASESCAQSVAVGCDDIAERSHHHQHEHVHTGLRRLCVLVLQLI